MRNGGEGGRVFLIFFIWKLGGRQRKRKRERKSDLTSSLQQNEGKKGRCKM